MCPIVYPGPRERVETREVVKPVTLSPSVNIGGIGIVLSPLVPLPSASYSFGLDIGLYLMSLRLSLPFITSEELIYNPSLPSPSDTYGFETGLDLSQTLNPSFGVGYELVSGFMFPAPILKYPFSLDVYGMEEKGSRPDVSMSLVSNPSPSPPETSQSFSTSVGVRKNP